jgi:hypothetical protein
MNGFEVYKIYLALKAHFTQESYDFFKYGGKTRAKSSTFDNRKDRYFFEKLAKTLDRQTAFNYILANLVYSDRLWIGEMFDGKCDEVYKNWQKKQESLSYIFGQDCENIMNYMEKRALSFNDMFVCQKDQHPEIFRLLLQEEITIEGFIILDSLLGFFKDFDDCLPNDVMWKATGNKCKNYKPFLPASNNTTHYRKIIRGKLEKHELIL